MPRDRIDRTGEMATFLAIARDGSLSAAARGLGLTASAVSRIVARLEARLGVQLIVRTTRTLRLTAEGESYARAARRILADLAEVEGSIADQASPRGRLRITASLAHGRLFVVPLLGDFTARYPGILVDLNLSDRIVDVLAGQADVAVRFGQLADSPLTARKLGRRVGWWSPLQPIWNGTACHRSPTICSRTIASASTFAAPNRAGRSARTGKTARWR